MSIQKQLSIVYHWNKKKRENITIETDRTIKDTLKEAQETEKECKVFFSLDAFLEFFEDRIRLKEEKQEDLSFAYFKATQKAMKEFPAYYDLLKPFMYKEAQNGKTQKT